MVIVKGPNSRSRDFELREVGEDTLAYLFKQFFDSEMRRHISSDAEFVLRWLANVAGSCAACYRYVWREETRYTVVIFTDETAIIARTDMLRRTAAPIVSMPCRLDNSFHEYMRSRCTVE